MTNSRNNKNSGKIRGIDVEPRLGFADFRDYKTPEMQRIKKNKEIIELVLHTADGSDNFEKGAVGFAGYGFVFRDEKAMQPYFPSGLNSKFCSVGALRGLYERLTDAVEQSVKLKSLKELQNYDEKYDLYFAGSLKTLVPTLEFGGYELFYEVWMFAKTPDGKIFPATFYWAQSGTSLSGWDLNEIKEIEVQTGKSFFPEEFEGVINFSPFNFSKKEEEEFVEALTCALDKVPPSDFQGIRQSDHGLREMGIESGEPFIRWIDDYMYYYDEETNSLKERKYPSEEYLRKISEFRDYIEPHLQILRQFPRDAKVEEKNQIIESMNYFEQVLYHISLSISVDLKWLNRYDAEVVYNKAKVDLLQIMNHNNLKEYIDNQLGKIKVDEISPLTVKIVDKKAGSSKKYDDSNFYALTPQEREKAIEIVEKVLAKIMTPEKNIDNLLQYTFYNQFKSFYD